MRNSNEEFIRKNKFLKEDINDTTDKLALEKDRRLEVKAEKDKAEH